jgi:hypothetical protein
MSKAMKEADKKSICNNICPTQIQDTCPSYLRNETTEIAPNKNVQKQTMLQFESPIP